MRKRFDTRAGDWLKNSFSKARERGKAPGWVGKELWKDLLEKFSNPDFVVLCEKNKRNRSANPDAATTVYRGGSKSVMDHRIGMMSFCNFFNSNSLLNIHIF